MLVSLVYARLKTLGLLAPAPPNRGRRGASRSRRDPAMRPRILSTYDNWSDIPGWGERVESIRLTDAASTRRGWLARTSREFYNGVKLWWLSRGYQAVVSDSSPKAAVFGLLERLRIGSKRRHLMLECLWSYPAGPLRRIAKTLQFRAALTRRSRAIVYARRERERFSSYFGIPAQRFVFIPYHTTLRHFASPEHGRPLQTPYLFAGGDTHRDYRTLCEAVAGLDIQVVIAVRDRGLLEGIQLPPNVETVTTDHMGFLRWMLHAHINVVPLEHGTLRSAGQQTFLNAMALGTVVVVTDVEGGCDYIQNWVDGVLVEGGNPSALRAVLLRLLGNPELVALIRANAARIGPGNCTERILSLCLDYLLSDSFGDASCAEFLGT
jgi:glycosyltransferase involved in cell wall biosynthesis